MLAAVLDFSTAARADVVLIAELMEEGNLLVVTLDGRQIALDDGEQGVRRQLSHQLGHLHDFLDVLI